MIKGIEGVKINGRYLSFTMVKPGAVKGVDVRCLIPEMIKVPKGNFRMGGIAYPNEQPLRTIEITKDFLIGKFPVVNEEYRGFLTSIGKEVPELMANPKYDRHPAVYVTWYDAFAYCNRLKDVTGKNYRLPTEAEWEYAARGPQSLKYPWGNEFDKTKLGNIYGTVAVDTHPEGASPFGVMHMSGNVQEWVNDWCRKYDYNDFKDPKGNETGTLKALRGGSWFDYIKPSYLRNAYRDAAAPGSRDCYIGFRIAMDLE